LGRGDRETLPLNAGAAWSFEYRRLGIGASIAGFAEYAVFFLFF
jgi:hypothetical protein